MSNDQGKHSVTAEAALKTLEIAPARFDAKRTNLADIKLTTQRPQARAWGRMTMKLGSLEWLATSGFDRITVGLRRWREAYQ